jgi:hypothetical protein
MMNWKRWAWACLLLPMATTAQLELTRTTRGTNTLALEWNGGTGPFLVQTSSDLAAWSDVGEPRTNSQAVVPAFGERAFHRVVDLDPDHQRSGLLGLIQTDQGEFGALMGRHRLKTRAWLWKTASAPHTGGPHVPSAYWRKLILDWQSVEDGRVQTWTGPLEARGTIATPGAQQLTVSWTNGTGASRRSFVLTLEFPYPIQASRTAAPLASDPRYTLKCTYAADQPELDLATFTLKGTRTDTIGLIELMEPVTNDPFLQFPVRKYLVQRNGVRVNLHFREGIPLYEGSPPWILKTYSLDRWMEPSTFTATDNHGLPEFSTDSYFARTLLPGHHNFYAEVLIEPDLDPTLSEAARAQLRTRNIRHIYTLKDLAGVFVEGDGQDIRFFGHDQTVRRP